MATHGVTGKLAATNYGRCTLCGRPVPRERYQLSHYCSPVCADLVRRYGYGTKPPEPIGNAEDIAAGAGIESHEAYFERTGTSGKAADYRWTQPDSLGKPRPRKGGC